MPNALANTLEAEVIDSSRAGSALSDVVIRTGGSVRGGRQYAALEEAAPPAEAEPARRAESTTPRSGGRTDQTTGKAAGGTRQAHKEHVLNRVWRLSLLYLSKMKGGVDTPVPVPPVLDMFWSWLGAFLGILLVGGLNQWLASSYNLPLLIASFGASAVLIFGAVDSKLAQPRNFIGGQVLSAVVGCITHLVLGRWVWLSGAVGMSLSLVVMMVTKTTHPPGGATALIASAINPTTQWQGFFFVVSVTIGSFGMLIVALLINNLHHQNRYPTFWF